MDIQIHKIHMLGMPEQLEDALFLGFVVLRIPRRYAETRDLELEAPDERGKDSYLVSLDLLRYPNASSPTLDLYRGAASLSEELYREIRSLLQVHPELASLFPKAKQRSA